MKKIPTVLVRNADDRAHVLDEVTPGCEWVLAGEGVATRKYDGTCVMFDAGGNWWARREVKPGADAPPNFASEDYDPVTGKVQGWEPIGQSSFAKFHAEAIAGTDVVFEAGTYELCGPKINGNPEGFATHQLIAHADAARFESHVAHSVAEIKSHVWAVGSVFGWEGLVWHHPDGRMAKLKARDVALVADEGCPSCVGVFVLDGRPMHCEVCGTPIKHANGHVSGESEARP
jgi:hypothetical protein